MEGIQSTNSHIPNLIRGEKSLHVSQVLLRTLAFAFTLTAACLIFTSRQTIEVFGISFAASYSDEPTYRFFAYANVVACVFSLLSLAIFFFLRRLGNDFILFLHDLLIMSLLLAACAAATAIGEIGIHGNNHTTWMPICNRVPKFCHRVKSAIIFSYLALVMYLILTILSALRAQPRPISNNSSSAV